MKTSVFDLDLKKLGTAVALSLFSLFTANQTVSASEMLNYIQYRLERGEKIVVKGSPVFDCYYSIARVEFVGAVTNAMCQLTIKSRGIFSDPELNQFLVRNCNSSKYRYRIVCPDHKY